MGDVPARETDNAVVEKALVQKDVPSTASSPEVQVVAETTRRASGNAKPVAEREGVNGNAFTSGLDDAEMRSLHRIVRDLQKENEEMVPSLSFEKK